MLETRKGQIGYFSHEKKRRILMLLGSLVLPVSMLIASYVIYGSNRSALTILAMLGMIPAAMATVGVIMIMLRHSLPSGMAERIVPHEGTLTTSYEMYLTSEKQNALVDALVICGNEIIALVTDKKTDVNFTKEHLTKMLRAVGYDVHVSVVTTVDRYVKCMDELEGRAEKLRAGIKFEPDPRFPDFDREDMIRHNILLISL